MSQTRSTPPSDTATGGWRLRVLGPLDLRAGDRQIPLGGPQQRLVLALLVATSGRPLTTEQLIGAVWPDDPPGQARKTIQVYVSKLRRHLGGADGSLRSVANGYRLATDALTIDAAEFERLVDGDPQARAAQPEDTVGRYRRALALWAGTAYADVPEAEPIRAERVRLAELRLVALEHRVDAELALGLHREVIGELEALTIEHPYRERFVAQLMVALYRSGRQADALRAFRRAARTLDDELGVEPAAELRELEYQILNHDPDLDQAPERERRGERAATLVAPSGHGTGPGAISSLRGYELREQLAAGAHSTVHRAYQASVGREVVVKVIGPERANAPDFVRHFDVAAQFVAQLAHPHIVALYDYWRDPGGAYLVMPWLRGGDLAAALEAGPWSTPAALRVVEQVGGALSYAHRRDLVHGAVTPGNVLLDDEGNAYLGGFGIAGGAASATMPATDPPRDGRARASPGADPPPPLPTANAVAVDVVGLAGLAHELLTGARPGPEAGVTSERLAPALRTVLASALGTDGWRAPPRVGDLVRALRRAAGVDAVGASAAEPLPLADVRNPYKGLRAFQRTEAADFHGREELVDRLVDVAGTRRLVAVVGPSGSGKSSVVRAGLLPRIADRAAAVGPADASVLVTEMFPGAYPFEELETALLRVAVDRPSGMLADLMSDDRGLLRVTKQIVPDERHEVQLVIDQFEELFSLVTDVETQRRFLDAVVTAVSDPRSQLRVIVTLRADFFDRPLEHAAFGELLERGLVPVTMPTRDELARAVSQPAALVGLDLEPGLSGEIVDDVIGQPGGLPLLQYALTELFRTRRSNRLTRADYERIGGVTGALGTRAEELYADLGPAAQEAAHQVFMRLVTVDESADDVRRRVRLSDLSTLTASSPVAALPTAVDGRALDTVLERYGSHRLLSFDRDPVTRGPTVEVAHEALLREWSRLRGWIESRRADLIVHRRFAATVDDWERSGRDPSFLPQGGRLEQFEASIADSRLTLTRPERDLLLASRGKRAADREREARAARRLRRVLAAVTALAVAAVAAGIVAGVQQTRAVDARFAAETRRLVSDAPIVADTNRQLGLLLAAEAYGRDGGPTALGALQRVLARTDGFLGYVGEGRSYTAAGWTSDGRLVAGHHQGISVIDPDSGQEVEAVAVPAVAEVAVSPTDATVAVLTTAAPTVQLVDLDSGEVTEVGLPPAPGDDATAPVMVATFSPDGTRLAVGTFAGDVIVLDVASGGVVWKHRAHPETDIPYETDAHEPLRSGLGVTHLAFSADGTRLATAGLIFVRVWDADDGAPVGSEIEVFRTPERRQPVPVAPLAICFCDETVVGVATQWGISAWDIRSGGLRAEVPVPPTVGSVGSTAVDFTAHFLGGGVLLTSVGGRTVVLSEEGDAREFQAMVPGVNHIAVDGDERRVAIAGDGRISLWSLVGHQTIATALPVGRGMDGGDVTSDGTLVTVGSIDSQSGTVWDLSEDEPRLIRAGVQAYVHPPDDRLWSIDISEQTVVVRRLDSRTLRPVGPVFEAPTAWQIFGPVDGWLAVSGGTADPVVRIFDPRTAELRHTLTVDGAGEQEEATFEVSPDRRHLVVSTTDGAAAVWDTQTWQRVATLSAGAGQIVNTVYTPDGRRLVTLAADGTLSVRDARSYRRVGSPIAVGTEITAGDAQLEISEDGRHLALGGHGVAQLWDLDARVQIGGDFPDGGATVDEDVRHMLTMVDDRALVWELDVDSWADVACRAAGRNLTRQEWAQFLPNDEYRATCAQWPTPKGPSDGRSGP